MEKKNLLSNFNITIFIIYSYFYCFLSCNNVIKLNSDICIIYAKSDIKESASNIFDQIKIIHLETTDSSLIGKAIDGIEVYDDKLFIQNYLGSHTNILCFDLSGKFLFNIDRMGQGPDEYTYFGDFFIDEHLHHLVIINEPQRFIHFDLDGNFLYDIRSDDYYLARQGIYLNDSTYLMFNDVTQAVLGFEGLSLLYVDARSMNVRYKTNNINEFYWTGSQPLSKYGDRVLCYTVSDSIFDISDSTNVKTVYYFYYTDIQANDVKRFRENYNKMNDMERLHYDQDTYNSGNSVLITTMYETSKYIVLGYMKTVPNEDRSIKHVILYDKKDKKVYDFDNINFDGFVLKNIAVLGSHKELLYCVLYSEITDDDKEKIRKSKTFSDADKKTLIEHKFEDNPLLFVLK
jgi:hypothetical protein